MAMNAKERQLVEITVEMFGDDTVCNQLQNQKGLTEGQELAVARILSGKTDNEIGEELGVSASTVWRWKTGNARFQLRLGEERERLRQQTKDRLQAMLDRALTTVEEKVAQGDLPAARLVIQSCGLLDSEHRLKDRDEDLQVLKRLRKLDAMGAFKEKIARYQPPTGGRRTAPAEEPTS